MRAPARVERISIRLRPHERALIEAAAEAERATVAEIARDATVARSRAILAGASR